MGKARLHHCRKIVKAASAASRRARPCRGDYLPSALLWLGIAEGRDVPAFCEPQRNEGKSHGTASRA